jgi:glycine oxidase
MRVTIVGCGIVGAAIAYELSQVAGLEIQVLDRQPPAQAATGAALGVLMAVISKKPKGKNFNLRLRGLQRYNEWIPQLEAIAGPIPYNCQGLLRLCFEGEDLDTWRHLAEIRQSQGLRLQILDRVQLAADYFHLSLNGVIGAVYSPDDRQVDPVALTLALVTAATQQGVQFQFNTEVTGATASTPGDRVEVVQTSAGPIATDWLILAAGLGSTPLTQALQRSVEIRPVLGQALQVRLKSSLNPPDLQPVISGNDVHLVPLGNGEYWIGATVEFSEPPIAPVPDAAALEAVMEQAIGFYPALRQAEIVRSWSGLRPRPEGRPAPIVEILSGYKNVVLASGHYRNGILLAPATAAAVRNLLTIENPSALA